MLVAPYNDLEAVKSLVAQHKDELAGIIVEPFQRLLPPKPGFLEGLRKVTEEWSRPAPSTRRLPTSHGP
jgi:glutamate-1-semialdehyde 2,1-aminomutase